MNKKGSDHINWNDRLTIEKMLKIKATRKQIAEAIGVSERTIYYELARGQCVQRTSELIDQEVYCPDVAERKYQEHLRAKGPDIKLGNDHAFASRVEDLIVNQGFSPAAALKTIEADDEEYSTVICESTLYNYIYRGDVFLELGPEHLREKGRRHNNRTKSNNPKGARAPRGESIEHRPDEINDRDRKSVV